MGMNDNTEHEPQMVRETRSPHTSLVQFVAREIVEMIRKERDISDDILSDEGRKATWEEIREGYLADNGDKFVGDILAEINLRIFPYKK